MGFGSNARKGPDERGTGELLREVEPEDLLKFGLIPEFIGRLPVLATLGDLSEVALIEILTRPKNALAKQYMRMFEMEGVKLRFQEEALHAISKRAIRARPAPAACVPSWKASCWRPCSNCRPCRACRKW